MFRVLSFANGGDTIALERALEKDPSALYEINRGEANMLHGAAANGNIETVEFLLNRGVNINSTNAEGLTALHLAVRWSKKTIFHSLVNWNGVNLNATTHVSTMFVTLILFTLPMMLTIA